jgi:hypothetical protein
MCFCYVGSFQGQFFAGLPAGDGTWTMDQLPGGHAERDCKIAVAGRFKGLQPHGNDIYTKKTILAAGLPRDGAELAHELVYLAVQSRGEHRSWIEKVVEQPPQHNRLLGRLWSQSWLGRLHA